ncbi:MAG TPA: GNAT family N-acetyltransferase [Nostocaceae cyanobacterium]|nr:GNAT family N-acetyltransferase [Nostocaceae cyanobacterium]
MTTQFTYHLLTEAEEVKQLAHIFEQCFVGTPGEEEPYINQVGLEVFRVLRQNQQLVGGLDILNMGQWWGGQVVPMGGIASVAIAPEYRGTGAAVSLLQYALQELYTKQIPISVLYPATQPLYRKVGYEQGGNLCTWEIPTQTIQLKEQFLPVQRVDLINQKVFIDLYQQQAKSSQGYLQRNSIIWQLITETPANKSVLYAYLIGSSAQPQGYLIFEQARTSNGTILAIRDWAILTTAAAKTFWAFLHHHRSQIDKVQWKSPINDTLKLLLPEGTAKINSQKTWFLRIVDLVKALELRGYPLGIEAELHLAVQDNLLSANHGKFILTIAHGQGKVTYGGRGDLQSDISGLAPLYTGLFTPHQLQLAGKLEATETALATASSIFTGVTPAMVDYF